MDSLAPSSHHSSSSSQESLGSGGGSKHVAASCRKKSRSNTAFAASVYQHRVDGGGDPTPTTPTRRRYQFEGTSPKNPRGIHGTILEEYTDAELSEEAHRAMQARFADWKPPSKKPSGSRNNTGGCWFEASEPYPFLSAEANEMMRLRFDDWTR
jgi:hypothetical protein